MAHKRTNSVSIPIDGGEDWEDFTFTDKMIRNLLLKDVISYCELCEQYEPTYKMGPDDKDEFIQNTQKTIQKEIINNLLFQ